jgi:hypothetical protein
LNPHAGNYFVSAQCAGASLSIFLFGVRHPDNGDPCSICNTTETIRADHLYISTHSFAKLKVVGWHLRHNNYSSYRVYIFPAFETLHARTTI